ncbi:TlpA family protein disulfide reductase [Bacillus taeanensis]|uniref:TlpA family protein disulfide reductase n=1 Tax=Bacillus taeanensis TaxID=273032 RepID=A0A366Y4Y1_9BACI|nr:TlpA disulfide reductase family protein [Bacillus taeanensis]RBW71261.1 TlpA family protein disulfide reductase [Bacillus taeanensis]
MKVPDFSLRHAKTNEIVSLSDFKGRKIMITFWVSWCPDCLQDLPQKNQFYQSLSTEELAFITINVTGREGNSRAGIDLMKLASFNFPVLLDEGTKIYDAFGCTSVPTTILLNEYHEIVNTFDDKASFLDILTGLSKLM